MTRETKIGLLTGLGVIVLVGVLLSEYLGGGAAANLPKPAAMADQGEPYRKALMKPVGAPAAEPKSLVGDASALSELPGNGPLVAFKTDTTTKLTGPVIGAPVSAEPAGRMDDGSAKTTVVDPLATKGGVETALYVTPEAGKAGSPVAKAATTLPAGEMYTILAGDNLDKIAKKFYQSAAKANKDRIIAANPGIKVGDKINLIAGKKLLIPAAHVTVVSVTPKTDTARVDPAKADPKKGSSVVVAPGSGDKAPGGVADAKKAEPKVDVKIEAPKATTYTVAAGDTLEKIAKKTMGSGSADNVARLQSLNGIKDPKGLKIGQVLKIPAKGVASGPTATAPARG